MAHIRRHEPSCGQVFKALDSRAQTQHPYTTQDPREQENGAAQTSSSTDAQKRYAGRVTNSHERLKDAFEDLRATHPNIYLKILSTVLGIPLSDLEVKHPTVSQPDRLNLAAASVTV